MNEYKLIHELEKNPFHTQRTLADKLNISLGKANYLLAGLIEKGIVKTNKLKNGSGKNPLEIYPDPKRDQRKNPHHPELFTCAT